MSQQNPQGTPAVVEPKRVLAYHHGTGKSTLATALPTLGLLCGAIALVSLTIARYARIRHADLVVWTALGLALVAGIIWVWAIRRGTGWSMGEGGPARLGFLLALVGASLWFVTAASSTAPGEYQRRRCAENLRRLGITLREYARAYNGNFPHSLVDAVVDDGAFQTEWLVCPGSSRIASSRLNSRKGLVADVAAGNHLSYHYVGRGLTLDDGADIVLMYEPHLECSKDGINILYGDGRVEFSPWSTAQRMINQLNVGINPPE